MLPSKLDRKLLVLVPGGFDLSCRYLLDTFSLAGGFADLRRCHCVGRRLKIHEGILRFPVLWQSQSLATHRCLFMRWEWVI